MERLLQDEVDTDPGGLHHAMFSSVASELDRALARFFKQDPRPWRSDVRRTASVEPAGEDLQEVPFWEMVYGIPDQMVLEKSRSYDYEFKSGAYGIIGNDGSIVEPSEIDRAVETRSGLYLQSGNRLFRLTEEDGTPEKIEIGQTAAGRADRWTLVSASETDRRLLVGEPEREEEVAAHIDGTDIKVHGTGHYKIELVVPGVAPVSDGDDLSGLPGYEKPLNLYNANGDRLSYNVASGGTTAGGIGPLYPHNDIDEQNLDPDSETLMVGPVIEESTIEGTGTGHTMFYEARHEYEYTHRTSQSEPPVGRLREARVSFADELEHFDRMPSDDDVNARQVVNRLCQVPAGGTVWVDAQGFVGDVAVSHPIEHVLVARHQVAVSGEDYVSVVEPASGKTLFQQRYSEHDIVGLTWTKNADFGVVSATPSGFDIYALRPRRDVRHENLMPSYGGN